MEGVNAESKGGKTGRLLWAEMCEREGRKEEHLDCLSQGQIVDQYSQLRSNKMLSPSLSALLVCPVKEAVGEDHWQVISIPAGSAYSGVGSTIISFWSYRSIVVPSGRRPAPPGWLSCCCIQRSTSQSMDGPVQDYSFFVLTCGIVHGVGPVVLVCEASSSWYFFWWIKEDLQLLGNLWSWINSYKRSGQNIRNTW